MYKNGKNITIIDHSVNSVKAILSDLRKCTPLSTEQEYDLWIRIQQGSKQAFNRLVESNMPYAMHIAKLYLPSGVALEDLFQAGCEGLVRAAHKFDASLGFHFISYATWYIECEVRKVAYDHLKHNHATVSLDEPIYDDEEDSDTMIIPSSPDASPDWHVRYDNTLNALKRGLDKQYWQGTGEMLDDYLSMMEKGFTTADFAREYHLTDQQMRRFLDMVRMESHHLLKTAA